MRTLLLLLATLATLLGCYKENEYYFLGLPEPTQSGENTFGCLINGKPWVAEIDPMAFTPTLRKLDSAYDEPGVGITDSYTFSLIANYVSLKDSLSEGFTLLFTPVYEAGEINFSNLLLKNFNFYSLYSGTPKKDLVYYLDKDYPGTFIIDKLDTNENICSGRFDLQLINNAKTDTINLTHGRFDVKYQPE
jgi:hypothetical protein